LRLFEKQKQKPNTARSLSDCFVRDARLYHLFSFPLAFRWKIAQTFALMMLTDFGVSAGHLQVKQELLGGPQG
jgi:hypothetical protein